MWEEAGGYGGGDGLAFRSSLQNRLYNLRFENPKSGGFMPEEQYFYSVSASCLKAKFASSCLSREAAVA